MAITYGAVSGKLRVGIDVIQSPATVGTGTTSVSLTVRWYVQTQAWGFNDDQVLTWHWAGNNGTTNYHISSGSGQTITLLVKEVTYTAAVVYGSTSSHLYVGTVSGDSVSGSTATHNRTWVVPARPSTVPSQCSAPTLTSITSSGATVNFTDPPGGDGGSDLTNFTIQVDNNSDFSSPVISVTDTATPYVATGLTRATTYYARVRANNVNGFGAWSVGRAFTTLATAPDAPSAGPTFSSITSNSATATYTAPATGGSAITLYTIQIAEDAAFTVNLRSYSDAASPYDFTSLTPGKLHYVRYRAHNVIGAGAFSPTTTFTTISGAKIGVGGVYVDAEAYYGTGGVWTPVVVYKGVGGVWVT